MKCLILLFILLLPSIIYADDVEERRSQILNIIDEELKEVAKLSGQYRHRRPRLLLRIAELYLEKARLIKDKEQKKYLAIPPKKRNRISKKKFFNQSRKYFGKAQKVSRGIIRRFKRFKLKADVYYILAFNAKEFKKKRDAKKYFSLVLRNAKKNSEIYQKAALALAEINYNDKNYKRALPLYRSGMKGKRNRWWTKDAFNMAWAQYRRKQYTKAINLMREIHRLSTDSNYIDVREQVEMDIGLFYLTANRLDDGIEFYRSLDKDISSQLYQLGKVLMDKKKPVEAERVLKQAKKGLGRDKVIDVNLMLLAIFQEYGKYDKHLEISRELLPLAKDRALERSQIEVYLYQLQKVGGTLQQQAIRKGRKVSKNIRRKKAWLAGEYFLLIGEISAKERGKYLYLKAETYYAAEMMERAFKTYQASFQYEKKKGRKKQTKLAIEGMLAVLASPNLSAETKNKYYISAYNSYLKIDRKSKRADTIHQRVFQKYFEQKDFKNAENVLRSYKINFPKNRSTQEAMIGKIMDYHRKSGNREAFAEWVRKIKNGEYYVSKKYGERLSSLLLSMRFDSIEKAASSGDKKRALEGYLKIYNDPKSVKESKKNAAHNITVLYFELGYADQTYLWANRTVSLMGVKDLSKFAGTYLTVSSELFNMQRFKQSAKLSEVIYNKICKEKIKEKTAFYKNSYIVYLTLKNFTAAQNVVKSAQTCNIDSKIGEAAQLEILKVLLEQKKWKAFESYFQKAKGFASLRGEIIALMVPLRDVYRKRLEKGRAGQIEKEMESVYKKAVRAKQRMNAASLWAVAELKLRKMQALVKRFNKLKLEFPQKKFDNILEKKFTLLDKIATQAEKVFKTRSGKGSIKAYQLIVESYQRLVREIREFKIVGKSPAYVATFKKAMKRIENPLLKKSLSYIRQARKLIDGGKVLSPHSYWFISKNRLPFDVEYHFSGNGILMDRRGRR